MHRRRQSTGIDEGGRAPALYRYSEPVAPAAGITVTLPNPAAAAAKRKRLGNHIVPVTVQAGATSSGFLPEAAGNDGLKRVKETVVRGQAPPPPPLPVGERTASYNAAAATNMFEETPESYYLHSVSTSHVNVLDENAVNIDTALGAFDAGLEEGNEEGGDDNEVEEIEKGVIYGSQPNHSKRSLNYTDIEDVTLVMAWDCVSLDAVADNDQTGKTYWQRIEDRFHRLMPVASARSLRSLQARFEIIKSCCSRWSGCLNQVRNAPPSGCTTDEYDHIAMQKYKQMSASKNKPFVFQHCWKLLEHSEKWRLRDQETPPKKGAFVQLDDNDDGDASKGEINQGKPDGREKEKAKKQAEAASLREKIGGKSIISEAASLREKIGGKSIISEAASLREKETICAPTFLDLVKSKETLVAKLLETEMAIAEKKHQDEMARWQELREVEERKVTIDERRVLLEENKVMAEILAEENKVMMMDPRAMDPMSREWWDIRRGEILQRRRQASGGATSAAASGGASAGGGDCAGELGDDGV